MQWAPTAHGSMALAPLRCPLQDWVGSCKWPASVPGCWQAGGAPLQGRIRLATRSLFFEPDDVRVPIVRCVCLWATGLLLACGLPARAWHAVLALSAPAETNLTTSWA